MVGSYVVERLRADGWTVRALVRDPSRASWLEPQGVELARGDVMDADSLKRAAKDCDAVFHTAAAVTPSGGWDAYRLPNVEGTRNMIAAVESSRARLLHLSSVAVYGASRFRGDGGATDESTPLELMADGNWYAQSKRESEDMVLAAHREGRIWATAVRPCVIYGRRDRQFVPRVGGLFSRGIAPGFHGGRVTMALVHAENVVDAAVRAIDVDIAGGKAYNTANDYPVTVKEFVRLAGIGLGKRVHMIPVSRRLAIAGAGVVQSLIGLMGGPTGSFGVKQSIDFLSRDNPFDSSLARRELRWSPKVRPEDGVPEAFRWWQQHERL